MSFLVGICVEIGFLNIGWKFYMMYEELPLLLGLLVDKSTSLSPLLPVVELASQRVHQYITHVMSAI